MNRSTVNDGLLNQIEGYVLNHFEGLWNLLQSNSFLQKKINKFLINSAIAKAPPRPYPFSTMAPYTSWDSLTDRTYSGRHLPPVKTPENLPAIDDLAALFLRKGEPVLSDKSTVLFPYFAQWFTDGFLRTDRNNSLKNTSNHNIDLSPLYGINKRATDILRSHQGGKLKSQMISGEEYSPYYLENGEVKPEFRDLEVLYPPTLTPAQKEKLFALGKERGNVQIGYVIMNTLFLREHNRVCDLLAANYPDWDDERLFQTARNIVIVLIIKVVVEEYINHISPFHFKFVADPLAFTNEKWYRENWMAVEFTLLYRWHGLIPSNVYVEGDEVPMTETLWNNDMVTSRGLGHLFEDASLQPAGEIGLFNTAPFLLETEKKSIQLGRDTQLASYNDYREMCNFPRVTDFDQITANPIAQKELERLYGHVDNVEYYVGLFAEDTVEKGAVAPLIGRLVSVDAFSQALTNPLLNEHIFNENTFSPIGFKLIQEPQSLSAILHRNIPSGKFKVTMTQDK